MWIVIIIGVSFYFNQTTLAALAPSCNYGSRCYKQCPINCKNMRCDANTGQCFGCVAGYQGQFCDQACSLGYYGIGCMYQCSENCNMTRRCNQFTGECDECETGYFGPDCKSKCGHCVNASQCHRSNGTCLRGCSAGFTGSFCREKCPSWSFGLNCVYRCNAFCRGNASCDHVTGKCNEGCIQGWNGPLCEKERQSCNDNSLVICIVVPMIIVLCGSIVNFIFWRRRRNAKDNESQSKEPSAENDKTKTIELSKQYSDLDHEGEDAHPYEYI
uniref:Multiple epidermal growth factor-like domains protein 10 n=1 Tax=Crassostrea virginica TaxID=6565 RepID=A0A8B8BTV9_CRAVI|nr:multiple epidermal growth factor-like domains protein 10 [Crassostrea virginica]